MKPATTPLPVAYFDGKTSQAQAAFLQIEASATLRITGPDGDVFLSTPVREVRWPERTRHGARIAQLPGGASVQSRDATAWDAWLAAHGAQDSWLVRAQQSWRGVGLALALLLSALGAIYVWGLPLAAQAVVALVPQTVDAALGRTALGQIDSRWMKPSRLAPDVQARITQRLKQAAQQTYGAEVPRFELLFRQSEIGPNAFALPGGTMVLTDELVDLLQDDDVILGVLGHELGHVTARHGMRQLVQVTALQAGLSAAFGDYASLLATAPLVLGSMGYSREHEREADAESVRFMRAAGISPKVMVRFFEAVRAEQKTKGKASPMGISIISSHPADDERVAFFRDAGR